jgi:ribosomal protein S18 acetylase RimI-like enzyme
MNQIIIRPLEFDDFSQWLPIWDGNNLGQRDESVTAATWERLTNMRNTQVNGLCADLNGELLGIVHYILHPTTGSISPVCYMQDVFTSPQHRRKGVGKRLVQELSKIGQQEKWARIYWLTDVGNTEAKAMYENFGIALNVTFYVLPLGSV